MSKKNLLRLIVILLMLCWTYFSFMVTTALHHGIRLTPSFWLFFLIVLLIPFLPGWTIKPLRHFMVTGFYGIDKKGTTQIHLNPWFSARCRQRQQVMKLKQQLHHCIAAALRQRKTVTLTSHLITQKRVNEITQYLDQLGIHYRYETQERATPVLEKGMLILIYLMADHRYAPVSRNGMTVKLTPLLLQCP